MSASLGIVGIVYMVSAWAGVELHIIVSIVYIGVSIGWFNLITQSFKKVRRIKKKKL